MVSNFYGNRGSRGQLEKSDQGVIFCCLESLTGNVRARNSSPILFLVHKAVPANLPKLVSGPAENGCWRGDFVAGLFDNGVIRQRRLDYGPQSVCSEGINHIGKEKCIGVDFSTYSPAIINDSSTMLRYSEEDQSEVTVVQSIYPRN